MSCTAIIAIVLGALHVFFVGALFFARPFTLRVLTAFPRHRLSALVLLFVDAAWCAWLIYTTPFETLSWLKLYLYAVTPVATFLVAVHLKDLLSTRALGGLFLLAATPLLRAIQWHDSSWRLVITVCVYLMVVKGMVLIMFPFKFREAVEFWFGKPSRISFFAGIALPLGLCLLWLGFRVL